MRVVRRRHARVAALVFVWHYTTTAVVLSSSLRYPPTRLECSLLADRAEEKGGG